MATDRRAAALALSEELLTDFELGRLGGTDLVRKTSRLARLLDDQDALAWLMYEVQGYPKVTGGIGNEAFAAAQRSGRGLVDKDGMPKVFTSTVGELEAAVAACRAQLAAAADAPVNISSANPSQYVGTPDGNTRERSAVRNMIVQHQGHLDRVLGSLHAYVSDKQYELRFGAAVQTAFERVRHVVDGQIATLVPGAVSKLASAFENAASDNPEQWANAASTCRRLLKAVADELRPPGPDVNRRKMGTDQYINRLVDWIVTNSPSTTSAEVTSTELGHLGQRLDAADNAGHKGAHAEVTQYDASRFITGTYLLLGDILSLNTARPNSGDSAAEGFGVNGVSAVATTEQPESLAGE